MSPPSESVDALVARGDYLAAAARAAADGNLPRAIQLYERIWRFADAVPLAVALGDRPLAVRLCLEARDLTRASAIADEIPTEDGEALVGAASALAARGHQQAAAALLARAGRWAESAEHYRKAGALLEAAAMFERAGRWQEAGRLYERVAAGDNREGDPAAAREAATAQLALGRLLGELGRPLEAARALQGAVTHPSTRAPAQRRLCAELLALGFPHAADEIARRIHHENPDVAADAAAIAAAERGHLQQDHAGPTVPRRFRVTASVGGGALGRVYAAEDELLGRTVALKVLSVGPGAAGPEREAFLRFLREAESIGRLRHANIVTLHELDEGAGLMVLEHLPGGTLADALLRGPLTPASARRMALDLLAGLAAAHRSGVVHRDVKPANIFFDGAGNAKLGDFGAAHLIDFGHTQTGSFVGTLAYLSPEQITGGSIGFPADLYSLGATLYEALTGRPPFLGPDVVGQHLAETPLPPSALRPDLDPAHDHVLIRALAKSPAERFASAEEMATAVASWPSFERDEHARPGSIAPPESPDAAAEPQPRHEDAREVGRTSRGRLVAALDARVGREVLLELLDEPLDDNGLDHARRLAMAGGPAVQRILALAPDGRTITYERLDGEEVPLASLPPVETARLAPLWPVLSPLGLPPLPERPVVRTAGGPVILVVATVPLR
jgi:eukaryotic-like serine/threonine-protein kinase